MTSTCSKEMTARDCPCHKTQHQFWPGRGSKCSATPVLCPLTLSLARPLGACRVAAGFTSQRYVPGPLFLDHLLSHPGWGTRENLQVGLLAAHLGRCSSRMSLIPHPELDGHGRPQNPAEASKAPLLARATSKSGREAWQHISSAMNSQGGGEVHQG